MDRNQMYEKILQIRTFENFVLELFSKNKISGTTHTYIGQEATAAAIMNYVTHADTVFSNHRCHGHYLAYGGDEEKLLAEIMSKASGLCEGRGGSQHIHYKNFYSNGIQGGIVPNALGAAFADKLDQKTCNTVVFLGDGTLGQGVVYEAFNIASIKEVPIIFVVEDNQYAMSTSRCEAIGGDIAERFQAFGIQSFEIESTDADELDIFFGKVFAYVNETRKPAGAVVHNYRLGAHSKGDDTRDPEEVDQYRKKDPVLFVQNKLGSMKSDEICHNYRTKLEEIEKRLEKEEPFQISISGIKNTTAKSSFLYHGNQKCIEILQETMKKALQQHDNLVFLGEDICDPYGGAFKVTKGLSAIDGRRVCNMPISEACMAGMGVGMALRGKIPVVEMMFGDFITLAFDQLLNHAVKYGWIYGENLKVPLVIRAPMGAKRGYGPTHSQSLEKFLIGIPLLRVLSLSSLHNPEVIYQTLFETVQSPAVVIENKKIYASRIGTVEESQFGMFQVREVSHSGYATLHLSMDLDTEPDYYLITYGDMTNDCIHAAETLMMREELQADVIVLCQLSPFPIEDIKELVSSKGKIVFVEEGTKTAGIGAEFISRCVEEHIGSSYIRIAAEDVPIPNGIVMEQQVIPDADKIVEIILKRQI